MSESLAEGPVSRFIDKWTRSHLEALDRHAPPQTKKRAALLPRVMRMAEPLCTG